MRPRKKKTTEVVGTAEVEKVKVEVVEDTIPTKSALFGEIFWEYRAKSAEWEKAFLDSCIAAQACNKEKLDPKYRDLLQLMHSDEKARAEVKKRGESLRLIQERIAKQLGISYEEFVKSCTVDFDTGIVRYLD